MLVVDVRVFTRNSSSIAAITAMGRIVAVVTLALPCSTGARIRDAAGAQRLDEAHGSTAASEVSVLSTLLVTTYGQHGESWSPVRAWGREPRAHSRTQCATVRVRGCRAIRSRRAGGVGASVFIDESFRVAGCHHNSARASPGPSAAREPMMWQVAHQGFCGHSAWSGSAQKVSIVGCPGRYRRR